MVIDIHNWYRHPRKDSILCVGNTNGQISFVDVQTLQTFSLVIEESEYGDPKSGIADMAWDSGEDHILVAYNDGMVNRLLNEVDFYDCFWRLW